jgi:hypothetical protein
MEPALGLELEREEAQGLVGYQTGELFHTSVSLIHLPS